MINKERARLINLIIYFAQNTKLCFKLKLFKLLYFADFRHYEQTGRPITCYDYEAWEHGPAPRDLFIELKNPPPDLKDALKINGIEDRMEFHPQKPFQEKLFSQRELKIIREIAEIFRDANAEQMEAASHEPGTPWRKVYVKNKNHVIPYEVNPDIVPHDEQQERKSDRAYLRKLFS